MQYDVQFPVIPGLTRNPEILCWIPAFAGMTSQGNPAASYREGSSSTVLRFLL